MPQMLLHHLLQMAQYHHWATQKCLTALMPLDEEAYRHNTGLFFKSIHGTLNHLLVAERIWQSRWAGETDVDLRLDQHLCEDRHDLARQLLDATANWSEWLETLPAASLNELFNYHNTAGEARQQQRGTALAHVFNHGTHHRGQISAAMTKLGLQAPALDLLYSPFGRLPGVDSA